MGAAATTPATDNHDTSDYEHGWTHHLFSHFAPIIMFIGFFALMCSLPLIASGMFAASDSAPIVNSATVPGIYGLAIMAAFVIGGCLVVWAPRVIAPYVMVLAVIALIFPGSPLAWMKGASVAVGFLGLATLGMGFISPK